MNNALSSTVMTENGEFGRPTPPAVTREVLRVCKSLDTRVA